VLVHFKMLSSCSYAGGAVPIADVVIAFSVLQGSPRDSSRILGDDVTDLARSLIIC
jgi:hypothetical protein